ADGRGADPNLQLVSAALNGRLIQGASGCPGPASRFAPICYCGPWPTPFSAQGAYVGIPYSQRVLCSYYMLHDPKLPVVWLCPF
ncbi:MAG: hypothetical protein WBE81_23495, partial [Pseudolabrys sp.]